MFNMIFLILTVIFSLPSEQLFAHQIPEYIEPPEMKKFFNPGDNAPGFSLIDHKGGTVSLKDWRDKVVLLSFISTECADFLCPIIMTKYVNVQKDLEKEDKLEKEVILAAITVEPSHDTPDVLKRYTEKNRMYPRGLHLLTGKSKKVKELLKEYGVLAMKEGLEFHFHHTITMIIGRDGVIKHIFYGDDAISDEVIERVRDLLF